MPTGFWTGFETIPNFLYDEHTSVGPLRARVRHFAEHPPHARLKHLSLQPGQAAPKGHRRVVIEEGPRLGLEMALQN